MKDKKTINNEEVVFDTNGQQMFFVPENPSDDESFGKWVRRDDKDGKTVKNATCFFMINDLWNIFGKLFLKRNKGCQSCVYCNTGKFGIMPRCFKYMGISWDYNCGEEAVPLVCRLINKGYCRGYEAVDE